MNRLSPVQLMDGELYYFESLEPPYVYKPTYSNLVAQLLTTDILTSRADCTTAHRSAHACSGSASIDFAL